MVVHKFPNFFNGASAEVRGLVDHSGRNALYPGDRRGTAAFRR
jgi:hypothetical protein